MKRIFCFILLTVISTTLFAQKIKEGTARFKIDYRMESDGGDMKAMLPTEALVSFKGDKFMVETTGGMFDQKVISDAKNQESVMLMDMMGNKMAVKTTKADIEKEKNKSGKPKVEITTDTKDIAGYKCTRAIIKTDDAEPMDVWFTKDIMVNNGFREGYDGIEGMMLEYTVNQKMFSMKMTCTEIKADKIDDKSFDIPSDYKMMTRDELMKMSGGGH
jgi:GLPGLI family protein